ncbi:Spy/CpxP family protein refolding chaperone [Acidobacteriota bacterium]
MKKILTVFAILSVVLLFAADSFAQPDQRMGRGKARMQRSPSRILFALKAHKEELKVTDDQLKQIEDMVFSFEEQQIAMQSQASSNRLAMRKLMSDRENVDYSQIKTTFVKAAEHRADMFISRLKLREEVHKVLTPEQQDALKSIRRERFKERGDFRGRRGFERHPRFRDEFPEC